MKIDDKPTTITDMDRTRLMLVSRAVSLASKTPFTREDKAQHDALLATADALDPSGGMDMVRARLAVAESRADIRSERTAALPETARQFNRFLRYGLEAVDDEKRAQSVGTETQGGYLVASEFSDRLYSMLKAYDPLFDPAVVTMIETATGAPCPIPVLDDVAGVATVIPENQISTIADLGNFSQVLLDKAPTWRSPLVKVSLELAQDSAYDIGQLLADAFAVRFQRGIGASLVSTLVAGAGLGVTAAAATLSLDNLHDLYGSVDPEYLKSPRAGWLMRHATLVAIRKLDVGAGVRLIPYQSDAQGRPVIFNLPVFISPSVAAIGTTNKSVLLGDIGSLIVRRVADSVRIRRLGERFATELQVAYSAHVRVNAAVAKATGADAPVKYLQHA